MLLTWIVNDVEFREKDRAEEYADWLGEHGVVPRVCLALKDAPSGMRGAMEGPGCPCGKAAAESVGQPC